VVNTAERPLLKRWTDLPEVPIAAYTTLEITAEKLRCVLQRLQCRDSLDLDLLLGDEDLTDAVELFRRKAQHKGLDPASFAEKFAKRVKDYEKRWSRSSVSISASLPTSTRSNAAYGDRCGRLRSFRLSCRRGPLEVGAAEGAGVAADGEGDRGQGAQLWR
jgi:nucleotidyltransferase AbiEii toxin of type IV toxin-antitoxin system